VTSYEAAGVSLGKAEAVVERLRSAVASTGGTLGGFAGLHPLDDERLLAATMDGVGTKLILSRRAGRLFDAGVDLAAHCVNDVITTGAEPLFFLDYFACGKLEQKIATLVIRGIARGCEDAGCALIGGETAEMPGMYPEGEYDLAGFAVGAVEKSKILTGKDVQPGDVVLGLASSGVHSNGFSLVRKCIERAGAQLPATLDGHPFREAVMAPTRIYVKPVLAALAQHPGIRALAHITGGGLLENIPRVLPADRHAVIDAGAWAPLPVFELLREGGNIEPAEMVRTFNCGIGMIVVVAASEADGVTALLEQAGETVSRIGRIDEGPRGCTVNGPEDSWTATHNA